MTATLRPVRPGQNGSGSTDIDEAIKRISLELEKHNNSVNVCLTFSSPKYPANVSYFGPAQMLEYSPETIGAVYRFERVTPALIHTLARHHANDFHELPGWGCPQSICEND